MLYSDAFAIDFQLYTFWLAEF